jgi:hypothetical protein
LQTQVGSTWQILLRPSAGAGSPSSHSSLPNSMPSSQLGPNGAALRPRLRRPADPLHARKSVSEIGQRLRIWERPRIHEQSLSDSDTHLRAATPQLRACRLPSATAALRVLGSPDARSESLIFTGRRGDPQGENFGFETRGSLRHLHSQLAESLGTNNKKNSWTSPPPPRESRSLSETEGRHRSFCDSGRDLAARDVMN